MAKPSFIDSLKRNLERRNLSFKSITAMILFGMIILTFVFLGDYGSRHNGGGNLGYAARVNSSYISFADLDSETERLKRSFAGMLGENLGAAQQNFIQAQAMQSLIQSELLAQYAEKSGIYATDHEVREMIVKELPYFQQEGQFRRELYEQILAANKLTPANFESKLRKDRKTQRVREVMEQSASPMNFELEKKKRLAEVQTEYRFVKLDKGQNIAGMMISDEDANTRLQDPEFKKRVEADFASASGKYDQDEEVRAAHILIKVDPSKPETATAALAKIQEIKKQSATQDFGALAAKNSEDEGSKSKQGDLGFFGRGRMVPEFEEAAFNMKVGEVSEPIKSDFGYHLIKVLAKKEAKTAKFEDVEKLIAKRMIADEKFDAAMGELEKKIEAKDMAGLNADLKKMNVSWQDSGPVALSADFIATMGSREASDAAFALNENNKLSRLVRDGTAKYIIEFKSETVKPAANEAQNATLVSRERAMDRLGSWLETLQKTAYIERNTSIGAGSPLQ